jgi:hypothetical protein
MRGVTRLERMPEAERMLAHEVWQAAWRVAIAEAARSQEERSRSRHGYDKHGDSDSLVREFGLEYVSVEDDD